MKPIALARRIYETEPCMRSFDEDLRLHLEHGFVFSTPDFFVMGRPVPRDDDPERIVDPVVWYPPYLCDCWHVHVLAGEVDRAWNVLPYSLPWMSFQRRNVLRFRSLVGMRRLSSSSP